MFPLILIIIVLSLIYYVFVYSSNKCVPKKNNNLNKFSFWDILKYLPIMLSYFFIP